MKTIIAGHRGVAGHFPENTRISIEAAANLGLEWIEIDVQVSADDDLVINHDPTIDRCSNGKGWIHQMTLEQLRQYDYGSWFSEQFAGETIMTLPELFALADSLQLKVNVEIKADKCDSVTITSLVARALSRSPLSTEQVLLSSFNHDIMLSLHQSCPDYRLGVLANRLSEKEWQLLKQINAFSCHLNYRWLTQKQLSQLHLAGYQVWCYTVNQPSKFALLDQVDAIFSDYPERFLSHHR
ncbi:glycerophosphodiester phosphodiesterase family protein [Vibrio sp.]|uniref:glycerophosphodiester phosphodiesterase family protein n=1 Tax=Vibrio sp. TaxID=678 RepID=UPI003D0DE9D1